MISPILDAPGRVDVIVIGAGINGIATARELSHRGLSVAVFDQSDIASETTAISTRLIHGGLKYLERAELQLVFECIRERNILFKTAPHLVEHYPMLIPFIPSNKRPSWMLAAGLLLQDLLSLVKPLPMSALVGPRGMRRRWPSLFEAGIKRGALYHDSHVPLTERLCVEMVLDATDHGAKFFTYTQITRIMRESSGVTGVSYRDQIAGYEGEISAPLIVNAAGPWIDNILALGGGYPRLIGPTRGSHFMVRDFPGAPQTCIFFESPIDRRPMFILPWEGMYMLGTTEIVVNEVEGPILADDIEVNYVLDSINGLIPKASLKAKDVLWSYSGVRPLPYMEEVDDPSKITRDYRLQAHDGDLTGLFTVVGGKLTTHRALGEDVAKKVMAYLQLRVGPSPTRKALYPGASQGKTTPLSNPPAWLGEKSRKRLIHVYGQMADQIVTKATDSPSLQELLDDKTGVLAAEVWWAIHREGAKTLGDIVLRRMATFINN
jgi:glycerol-3-phosphate dehydrogenase